MWSDGRWYSYRELIARSRAVAAFVRARARPSAEERPIDVPDAARGEGLVAIIVPRSHAQPSAAELPAFKMPSSFAS